MKKIINVTERRYSRNPVRIKKKKHKNEKEPESRKCKKIIPWRCRRSIKKGASCLYKITNLFHSQQVAHKAEKFAYSGGINEETEGKWSG